MSQGYRIKKESNGEPCVNQHRVNGWNITWNPDDTRFYLERGDWRTGATFKELRNAVQWAKKH